MALKILRLAQLQMLRTNQIQHLLVKENDDSDQADVGVTYPAYMYNALVDEYNSLTDGEKMNHVSKVC